MKTRSVAFDAAKEFTFDGTTYMISGTSGVKTYIQNDVTVTDEYFPRAEKILAVDAPMSSAIRVVDGILYVDAYQVSEDGTATVCDRFAIQKDTAQGDVNADYVDPDDTQGETSSAFDDLLWAIFSFLVKVFKVIDIFLNIVIHYDL